MKENQCNFESWILYADQAITRLHTQVIVTVIIGEVDFSNHTLDHPGASAAFCPGNPRGTTSPPWETDRSLSTKTGSELTGESWSYLSWVRIYLQFFDIDF